MVKFSFGRCTGRYDKPPTVVGKVGISLFFFVFFGMGLVFEVLIIRELGNAISQRFWKKTACTILASDIEEKPRSDTPYTFTVSYEYEFSSKKYTSAVYKRGYSGSDKYDKVGKLVERYPVGKKTFCYVNTAEPSKAVLKHQSLLFGLAFFFVLIFVLIGAGGLYAVWFRGGKKGGAEPIAAKARRRGKKGKYGLAVFFSIFALAGAGMLYPLGIRRVAKTLDAEKWAETPCKIVSAQVRSHTGDDSTTYSVDILYEYEFDGKTYKSNRYDFIGGSSSGHSGKARVVSSYEAAKNPVCYVNPEKPSQAVLKRGFHLALLFALFPLPFLAVGVGGLVFTIRGKKGKLKSTTPQWMPQTGEASVTESPFVGEAVSGRVVLKPKYSPLTKLLGAIAVAVFWNGIVSIFVYQAVQGFRRGRPEWGLTLFMIPFVLIGIGMIGFVFYQLLALFNPRPTLRLSSGTIPLGGAAELGWRFSGRTSVISQLKITLLGREEATYRRGTKTHTDKNTFYEMEILATTERREITSGQVGLIIPADTMHSFEAQNNKIIWAIEVHGDIKRWPDVKESFKITVAPAKNN